MEKKESVFSIIKKYGRDKSSYIIPCIILQIIQAVSSLVPIFCIWQIIRITFFNYPNFDGQAVGRYILIAVLIQILATLCAFAASILAHILAFEVENGLREKSFSHLLDLPLSYFQKHESGRLRKIIDDNAGLTHSFIAHQLPDLVPGILIPIIVLLSLFVIDFRFGLVLIFSIVLGLVALASSFSTSQADKAKQYQYALENINTEGVEYFRGIPVVKVFQQSVLSFNNFYEAIKEYEKFCLDYTVSFRNSYILMNIALSLPYMLVPIVCIFLLASTSQPALGLITDAVFYILVTIVLSMSMFRMARLSSGVNNFNLALEKINEILAVQPIEKDEDVGILGIEKKDPAILLDDISFSYDGERKVIDGISYGFEKGKSYALVGKSGSGKSTLVNLISRFYDVDQGDILINGKNVRSMDEEAIFDEIAIVFQNQRLLKDSIFENVRMYDESKGEVDVLKALEDANAMDIVEKLDQGIYSQYGSKGTYFSGGEIQRIALARAFLKDREILLLDEAMAFVDADNEEEILEALDRLKSDRTTIMILHRLNSAKSFDEIIMVDKGKIIGSGSHEDMLVSCPEYKDLYEEYEKTLEWRITND